MIVKFNAPTLSIKTDVQRIGGSDIDVKPLSVTENGTYTAPSGEAYSPVVVDVEGIVPTGTFPISENGQYDITQYASVDVTVPQIEPTGTIEISQNGTYDVSDYAEADVDVPQPSGTLPITQNGTYNVSSYAEATVNVQGGGGNADGIIDGSVTTLENNTATKIRREFASIAKRYTYRNLPSGYTQVEYIQANGAEYLDTGVVMDTNVAGRTCQMSIMYMTRGVSTVLLGARLDNTNIMSFLQTYYGTPSWQYTNKSGSGANLAQNRVYVFQTELRNGWQAMQIDGAAQTQGTNGGVVTSTLTFYLFARNNNGTADSFCNARVYDCVVRNGNQTSPKLCDLVPCIEDATGKYGMYDLISNTFKGNLGSGDFTGGRVIPNIVYGYTSVDICATEIGDYAFYNSDLSSLTLRANQVVSIGENALAETPIAKGSGRIYVPSELVAEYKAQYPAFANVIQAYN